MIRKLILLLTVLIIPCLAYTECGFISPRDASFTVSPDKSTYERGEQVTVEAELQTSRLVGVLTTYNLSLFTNLEEPLWRCSGDGVPCQLEGNNPSIVISRENFGAMPNKIRIRVNGKIPEWRWEQTATLLRIRGMEAGELCEILNVGRTVTSKNISLVAECLERASDKIAEARGVVSELRGKGVDVKEAEDILKYAEDLNESAYLTYKREGVTDSNMNSLLDKCERAYTKADDAIRRAYGIQSGMELWGMISGTVIPLLIIVIIVIVLLVFMRRGRWERL